jgi:ribosomal protein S18 acetylase RimI-like enzyme
MGIENCNPENIEACASLLAQVYSEPEYGENWKEKEAFDYLTRFYVIEPLGCFVAVEDKELIGAIFSYSYPWQSETLVYIQELFVSSKQRKKGVAKLLLKSVGKGRDVKAWLVANESTSASGFYKRMGFKTEGLYKFNYGIICT